MKFKFKALVAALLSVVMFAGTIPTVIAEDADTLPNNVVANETADDVGESDNVPDVEPTPDPELEPEPKPEPRPDDIVGEIFLCYVRGFPGHMWVYIRNTSDQYLKIGLYDVPPGEAVSVATYGLTRYDGIGVYYNLEMRRNENYCGEGYIRLKDSVTRKEAENVTSTILTANYWDPFFNCTTFACRVWNRASNIPMIPMVIPEFAALFMLLWGANNSEKMEYRPPEDCYKMRGTGKSAYLEHCCQKTLDA